MTSARRGKGGLADKHVNNSSDMLHDFYVGKSICEGQTSFKDGAFAALDANMRCIRSLPSIFALPASLGAAILRHCFRAPFVFSVEGRKDRQIAKPKGLCETKKEVVAPYEKENEARHQFI